MRSRPALTKRLLAGLELVAQFSKESPARRIAPQYFTHQLLTHVQLANHAFPDRETAFSLEAIPWIDDVYRFALSLTRDESDADDIVQDTFLRAYRSWHTYLPGSDCRRWLFTICRNVFLRSRERARPTIELDSSEVDAASDGSIYPVPGQETSDDMCARLDLAPALDNALARVPEPFRSTVIIVDMEDQSYESAAASLGVPIGTVRSRLFRGRRLMQEYLLSYAADAGFRPQRGEQVPVTTHLMPTRRADVRRSSATDLRVAPRTPRRRHHARGVQTC
jgi:RNA polymerase sigma-70 factor (ECF subfamily)